jgi:hypothetical protein
MHDVRPKVKAALYLCTVILLIGRLALSLIDLYAGDESAFLAFPLSVMLPAFLIFFLNRQSATTSQEGILMRLGTQMQLMAIIALPNFAIYLALGLPVVFLIVEIYSTRIPDSLRNKVSRVFVT